MDFKEYLLNEPEINLAAIAKRMWPNNASAKTYLSSKLNGLDNRTFTDKDEELARKALNDLGVKLIANAKKKSF